MNPIATANGHYYRDQDGTLYIDLISGIQNVALGHGHPKLTESLQRIARQGVINSYTAENLEYHKLADLLGDTFEPFTWTACSTGTEAIERILQMVKLRRGDAWCGRILYLEGAFHGKSWATAAVRYEGWGDPYLFECYEDDFSTSQPFDAIIYEPVQGLTGRIPEPAELRDACQEQGAYLIADEMITGFGRCGPMLMSQHWADYIATGKGVSMGLPLALIASRHGLPEIPTGWSTTASRNALCCGVAHDVLKLLLSHPAYAPVYAYEEIARKVFGAERVAGMGALLHITMPDVAAAKEYLVRNRIIALYTDRTIRLAPCFGFPLQMFENILRDLKGYTS